MSTPAAAEKYTEVWEMSNEVKKIIPCKHCRHYQYFGHGYGACTRLSRLGTEFEDMKSPVMRDDDYCSFAEYCFGWEDRQESGLLDD